MPNELTRQERACISGWLRHRRGVSGTTLRPLPEFAGRADRYYMGDPGIIGVEVTRLLDPEKEIGEANPLKFLRRDIAPRVEGFLPGKYYAMLTPPWDVPPVGSRQRMQLAENVALQMMMKAPLATMQSVEICAPGNVRLALLRGSSEEPFNGVVYGGMSSLYGGWEGEVRSAAKDAISAAISQKAAKRQLEGDHIARKVLLLHDLMGEADAAVLDEALATLSPKDRDAFDEIAVVSHWNRGSCYGVGLQVHL